MTRDQVVAEARRWIGTRFVHQARVRGGGVDCLQLVVRVGVACGLLEEPEPRLLRYGRTPNPRHLLAEIERRFDRVESPFPADVALIAWRRGLPMHAAIFGDDRVRPTIIHAYSHVGEVVEHAFTAPWISMAHSFWRFRGIE